MKKTNHILLNLTDQEFQQVEKIANDELRTLTATARILILEALKNRNNKK